MNKLTSETLLDIGFVDIGGWAIEGNFLAYKIDEDGRETNEVLLDARNALYAFVQGEAVRYIGKTARTIRKRFVGYCRPGETQVTNKRCHDRIKAALNNQETVRIMVFAPISHFRYGDFEINLAAGLEDSLIERFSPPWNGRDRRDRIVTEDAQREEAETPVTDEDVTPAGAPVASFEIELRETYYRKGYINPGVQASRHLGGNGEPIMLSFDDGSQPIVSRIDRTANSSGAVRIVGRNREIAQWFQQHFREGDKVQCLIMDAHNILLRSGR